jgi:hypothetical protein
MCAIKIGTRTEIHGLGGGGGRDNDLHWGLIGG